MSDLSQTHGASTSPPSKSSQESIRKNSEERGNSYSVNRPQSSPRNLARDLKTQSTRTLHDGHQSISGTHSTKTRPTGNLQHPPTLQDSTYPADSNCPPVIGRYQILQRIGGGAMGVVFSAYDPSLQRRVAIKLMRRSDSDRNLARFIQEAQLMARLSHPNVVQVFEAGQNQDRAFLAMELIEGQTLGSWLQQQPRSVQEILDVFVQIGNGLHAAHNAGVIHRDFKPDNIFIATDGRARVGDFGVARLSAHSEASTQNCTIESSSFSKMTAHGEIVGTPAYMSPEQLLGQEVDARSDQFAFCVALYESLYGKRPFAAQSPEALAALLLDREELRVQFPHKRDPRWIRAALSRGLSLTPSTRFGSMLPLLAELQRKPRPRWPLAMGVSAIALIAWLAVDRSNQMEESICPTDSSILDGVWDNASRSQVRKSILTYELPYRARLADFVEEQLDEYSSQILHEQVESCRATFIKHTQSEQLLDRQKHCLDDRLRSLRALTSQINNPTKFVSGKIEKDIAELPNPRYCRLSQFSIESWAPPASETVALQVKEIRNQLTGLFALSKRDAIEKAKKLIEKTDTIDFAPLEAESWFTLGRLYHQAHHLDDAVEAFLQAVDHAEASGHDELTWRSWINLTKIANSERINLVEAERWLRRSEALLKRLGNPDQMAADVLDERGRLAMHQSDIKLAELSLKESITKLRNNSASPERIAETREILAYVYRTAGKIDLAKRIYSQARDVYVDRWHAKHPKVARARFNLGTIFEKTGELESSAKEYSATLDILLSQQDPNLAWIARVYQGLATISLQQRNLPSSRRYIEKSIEYLEHANIGGSNLANAYNVLGSCHFDEGHAQQAVEAFTKAMTILDNPSNRIELDFSLTLINLGDAELALGNTKQARLHFKRSIRILESIENIAPQYLLFAIRRYAQTLIKENDLEEGIRILEDALKNWKSIPSADANEIANVEWALAQALAQVNTQNLRNNTTNLERPLKLAHLARSRWQELGHTYAAEIAQIDHWMQ